MYDTPKVLIGIAVFLGFMLSPFAYNTVIGDGAAIPELEKPQGAACIKDTQWMFANHMTLLDTWRTEVVRNDDRTPVQGLDGKLYEKSLTRTCLSCHRGKANFCDRCHAYANVTPTCFNCHVDTSEKKP
jgi:hypothetical protein